MGSYENVNYYRIFRFPSLVSTVQKKQTKKYKKQFLFAIYL